MLSRLRNWMMKRKAERVFAAIRKQLEAEKRLGLAPSKDELIQEREEIITRLQELGVKTRRDVP